MCSLIGLSILFSLALYLSIHGLILRLNEPHAKGPLILIHLCPSYNPSFLYIGTPEPCNLMTSQIAQEQIIQITSMIFCLGVKYVPVVYYPSHPDVSGYISISLFIKTYSYPLSITSSNLEPNMDEIDYILWASNPDANMVYSFPGLFNWVSDDCSDSLNGCKHYHTTPLTRQVINSAVFLPLKCFSECKSVDQIDEINNVSIAVTVSLNTPSESNPPHPEMFVRFEQYSLSVSQQRGILLIVVGIILFCINCAMMIIHTFGSGRRRKLISSFYENKFKNDSESAPLILRYN